MSWYDVTEHDQWRIYMGILLFSFFTAFATKVFSLTQKSKSNSLTWLGTVKFGKPSVSKRRLIHWFVCLPIRGMFVALVYILPQLGVPIVIQASSIIPLFQSFTWLSLTIDNTQTTGQFGGKAWWAPQRIVHSATYMAYAVTSILDPHVAYIPLAVDVGLSIIFAILHDIQFIHFVT